MIEKFNLTLSGLITTSIYKIDPTAMYPTRIVDNIECDGKVSIRLKNGVFGFTFWDYELIPFEDEEKYDRQHEYKIIHKGKFELVKSFEAIQASIRKVEALNCRRFNVKGSLEWIYHKQEFKEFDMEIVEDEEILQIWARWPQRSYPRGPLEMRSQSVTLKLDEKNREKYNIFWEKVKREEG